MVGNCILFPGNVIAPLPTRSRGQYRYFPPRSGERILQTNVDPLHALVLRPRPAVDPLHHHLVAGLYPQKCNNTVVARSQSPVRLGVVAGSISGMRGSLPALWRRGIVACQKPNAKSNDMLSYGKLR